MRLKKIIDVEDAVAIIHDGDVVASSGCGGNGMLDIHIDDRLSYDCESNTVFMNYAGMRVRTEADIVTILDAVDRLLAPLGKELENRRLSSRVFESASEARRSVPPHG